MQGNSIPRALSETLSLQLHHLSPAVPDLRSRDPHLSLRHPAPHLLHLLTEESYISHVIYGVSHVTLTSDCWFLFFLARFLALLESGRFPLTASLCCACAAPSFPFDLEPFPTTSSHSTPLTSLSESESMFRAENLEGWTLIPFARDIAARPDLFVARMLPN